MLKTSLFASTMAVLLAASLSMPTFAASKPKKVKSKQQQQQQQEQQQGLQAQQAQPGTYDNSASGRTDADGTNIGSGSAPGGGSDSITMFKAGNTSLPAGTYAMTNVSTGAAFVVIVDDTGDMRAQDARAMNLIDDKSAQKSAKNNRKKSNSGVSLDDDSGSSYSKSNSNYDDGGNSSGNRATSSSDSQSNSGSTGLLPPQQTPPSAILPTPNTGGHPLLQGATQGNVYAPSQQSGGLLPKLFTQQNPLAQQNPLMPAQPAPGIQGKIQAELQRQLNKQLRKYGSGNLEQQVRKMINKF